MRQLFLKLQCVLASGMESNVVTESPWLIMVQMNTLHGHKVILLLKKIMFPLLFPAHPLPRVGSGLYTITKKLHQEVIQIKTFFLPVLVSR